MRKTAVLVVVMVLSSGASTACSGGDNKAYCHDLQAYADQRPQAPSKQQLDQVKKLQGEAPKELRDDYRSLVSFNQKVVDAGSDQSKVLQLVADAKELQPALQAISKHAKEQCQVTLPTKL